MTRKHIVPAQRDAMLARFEELQDTRPGQMLVEDLTALHLHGDDTARVGFKGGTMHVFVADEGVAARVQKAIEAVQAVRVRVLPKVTREVLDRLPSAEDDE